MNAKSVFLTAVLTCAVAFVGCATQEQKPAATPEPAAAPAPTTAPAAPPVAKPEPPKKPAVVNLSSTELFEFNKATLTPQARTQIDSEVITKLKDVAAIRYINVNGHADRFGTAQYNQKLSEQRAEAVRAYLVSKGADPSKVETFGFGKTTPVKSCPGDKKTPELIACLAPNRRVVVEIQGTPR